MPTDRFRMARIHPGHNGPPLLHNVIPDLTLDRVKSLSRLGAVHLQASRVSMEGYIEPYMYRCVSALVQCSAVCGKQMMPFSGNSKFPLPTTY